MKRITFTKTELLYVISSIIAYTYKFNNVRINYLIKYIIALLWTIPLIFIIIRNKDNYKINNNINYLFLFLLPIFLIFILTLCIWLFDSDLCFSNLTRLLSNTTFCILPLLFSLIGYLLFEKKVINLLFISICISYIIGSLVPFILTDNVLSLIVSFLKFKEHGNIILEVHDLTFAVGFFFIYYLLFEDNKSYLHKTKIFMSLFLLFAGFKRIIFLALLITFVCYYMLKKNNKKYCHFFISMSVLVLLYMYIYIVKFGILNDIVNYFNLNTMGRISMYNFSSNYFEFSPFYIGQGYTKFSKMIHNLYLSGFRLDGYGIPASIHSDVLVYYIELGFIPFFMLFYYYLKTRYTIINKKFSGKTGVLYFVLTIYFIVLLVTDNVSSYFCTLAAYFIIPIAFNN